MEWFVYGRGSSYSKSNFKKCTSHLERLFLLTSNYLKGQILSLINDVFVFQELALDFHHTCTVLPIIYSVICP